MANKNKKEKCELYLDHDPVWAGDGYFCSKCMLEFVSKTKNKDTETANASYFYINYDRKVHKTIRVSDKCLVDIDEEGLPVGVEEIV